MPVIHSERINASSAKSPSDSTQAKLRGITETELKAWRKAVNDQAILDYDFLDLYEIFDYPFKVGAVPRRMLLFYQIKSNFLDRIVTPSGSTSRNMINGVWAK